jgi:hypothetical protein
MKRASLKANITLTTVVVIGAILLISGTALLFMTIDLSIAAKSYVNSGYAEVNSISCLEESLNRLKQSSTYTGTLSVTYNGSNCQSTITDDPVYGNIKHISIISYYGEYQYAKNKRVDISTDPDTLMND